jgi:hypothetical protein
MKFVLQVEKMMAWYMVRNLARLFSLEVGMGSRQESVVEE